MIYKVYTVHDQKSELYEIPKLFRARGEAMRAFTEGVNKQGTTYNSYPGDFHFFEIGEYDDCTARFKSYDLPINLGCALEYIDNLKLTRPQSLDRQQPSREELT